MPLLPLFLFNLNSPTVSGDLDDQILCEFGVDHLEFYRGEVGVRWRFRGAAFLERQHLSRSDFE